MSAPHLQPHLAGLQTLLCLVLCGSWSNLVVARPNPIVVFPGKATWGYSTDVSEPISFGGGSGRSSRSLDTHTGNFISARITSRNTEDGLWVGKAFPVVNSPTRQVVSASFTVKGGEKDYRNVDLHGISHVQRPTLPRQSPSLRPNLPDVRPPFVPMFAPNHFPLDVSRRFPYLHFNFNDGYRVHDPREHFYKTLHGRFQNMVRQPRTLVSDEILSQFGRNLSDKNFDDIREKFSRIIIKNILPHRADGNVSDEYNLDDERNTEAALVTSSEKITSVHERSVDEDNIYNRQVYFGRDQSFNEIIATNKSTALDSNETKAIPDDQTVLASIYVKPVDSGTLVAYYEDVDSSPYPPSKDQVNGLGSNYSSSGNSTKKRLPQYIIVKDPGFTAPVSVLGVEEGTKIPFTVDRKAIEDSYRYPPSSNDVSRTVERKKINFHDIAFPISRRGTSLTNNVTHVGESRRSLSSVALPSTEEDQNISSSSDMPSVDQNNNSFAASSTLDQPGDHSETTEVSINQSIEVSSEESNEQSSDDDDCSCDEEASDTNDKLPVDEYKKHSQSSEVSFHDSHKHHFPFDEYLPGKEKRPLPSGIASSLSSEQKYVPSNDVSVIKESFTLRSPTTISENSTINDTFSVGESFKSNFASFIGENLTSSGTSSVDESFISYSASSVGESSTTNGMSSDEKSSTLNFKYSSRQTPTTAAPHTNENRKPSSNSIYSTDVLPNLPTMKDITLTKELLVTNTVKNNEHSPQKQATYPTDKNIFQPDIEMLETEVSSGHPLTTPLGVITLVGCLLVAILILL
nr:uncharacterized protein LOC123751207 [Procambarus clarkii]